MAKKKIDKATVRHLLESTDEGYRWIASQVGCSHQRIAQLAKDFGVDIRERDGRSRKRSQSRHRAVGRHGFTCERCGSSHIIKDGVGENRYRTQRYKCKGCGREFMREYKWITSGDRDRHLAEIARSSGYARPDMTAHWQQLRERVWPYLQGDYGDAAALLRAVNDAIPRTVPEHMRADICQDAVVAILDCSVERSAVTLKPFLAKWFKGNLIGWRPLSLDAPSRYRENQSVGQEMGIY